MKKILITGGAGFIGSHLSRELLKQWHEIICLDNLFTGNKSNIYELEQNPKFTFVLHDITQPFRAQVDEIYNLACPASPIHYQKNPVETIKTSFLGTMHMLELATKTGAKILQTSTSEVYGDPLIHPQPEKYFGNVNPIWIRSCYDEWKRAAETLCMDYHKQYGTHIRIVRIFNTYGPYMHPHDGRVVSNFIRQALHNQDITIYWDGSQTRSFQYISDLIRGMLAMMGNTSRFIGPVNLGSSYEFTMVQLAETILQLIPSSTSKIIFQWLPQDDPKQRKADNWLAREMLWREPTIELQQWLQETIAYFQGMLA